MNTYEKNKYLNKKELTNIMDSVNYECKFFSNCNFKDNFGCIWCIDEISIDDEDDIEKF
ncbi:hypothetical protein [Clostridioides difficile]|uniref:hypothetical protein n=1 Tax=Clostridioides difficile TaxID=1496 RepID=UPI0013EF77CE|nr:hypothetical protein [Clostridioides difficile]MDM9944109.1 hypothetical protein [Clostridioides difficile]